MATWALRMCLLDALVSISESFSIFRIRGVQYIPHGKARSGSSE